MRPTIGTSARLRGGNSAAKRGSSSTASTSPSMASRSSARRTWRLRAIAPAASARFRGDIGQRLQQPVHQRRRAPWPARAIGAAPGAARPSPRSEAREGESGGVRGASAARADRAIAKVHRPAPSRPLASAGCPWRCAQLRAPSPSSSPSTGTRLAGPRHHRAVPAALRPFRCRFGAADIRAGRRASWRRRAAGGTRLGCSCGRARARGAAVVGALADPSQRAGAPAVRLAAGSAPAAAALPRLGGVVVSARITIGRLRAPWRHARSSPAPRRARSPCRASPRAARAQPGDEALQRRRLAALIVERQLRNSSSASSASCRAARGSFCPRPSRTHARIEGERASRARRAQAV